MKVGGIYLDVLFEKRTEDDSLLLLSGFSVYFVRMLDASICF